MSVTVSFCSAKGQRSFRHDISEPWVQGKTGHLEGKGKKRKRGKEEWSMTFQTGFQERRKGLWFISEAFRRLGHNYRESSRCCWFYMYCFAQFYAESKCLPGCGWTTEALSLMAVGERPKCTTWSLQIFTNACVPDNKMERKKIKPVWILRGYKFWTMKKALRAKSVSH